MENAVLKIIFTVFLGIMIAFFVGFGIDAFYPAPLYPQEINDIYNQAAMKELTDAQLARVSELESNYQILQQDHNRVVSIIVTVAAVLFLVLSLVLEKRSRVMTNGVMLGGLFTLLYGVGLGLNAQDSMVTFITVGVGLVAVILIGLRRFGHAREEREAALASGSSSGKTATARKPAAKTRGESRG